MHTSSDTPEMSDAARRLQEAFEQNPAVRLLVNLATSDTHTREMAYRTLAKVAAETING